MIIQENLTIQEKLKILTDAAKYDVACTSSGVQRRGKKGHLGNSSEAGSLSQFRSRRTLYFPAEDPFYQSVYL